MLSKTDILNIKPQDKTVEHLDYNGLYLVVDPKSNKHPAGRYYWKYITKYQKSKHKKVLGNYYKYFKNRNDFEIDVSADEARAKAREFRIDVETGFVREKEIDNSMTASKYPAEYARLKRFKPIKINPKTNKGRWPEKRMRDAQRDFDKLIKHLGDRPPHLYQKKELSEMIITRLDDDGVKTTTIRRNFNSYNSVINFVYNQLEIDHLHRFGKTIIPNEGEDTTDRPDYTSKQLAILRRVVHGSDNIAEQIIALLIDTGMRSGEAIGLKPEDLILDEAQPYIALEEHPFRRLKNKNSQRMIPLTGASLEIIKFLGLNNEWVFQYYFDDNKNELRTKAANKTVNATIKRILGKNATTSHSFRHTLSTRLRNAGCPKSLREEMGGWASDVSDGYGTPDDLMIKGDYLRKSLEWKSKD